MRKYSLLQTSALAFSCAVLAAGAAAQTAEPAHSNIIHPLSPAETFGTTYGTSNLGRAPSAAVSGGGNGVSPALRFDTLKAALASGRLPPANLSAFVTYTQSDPLLNTIETLGSHPEIGPTSLMLLIWNHVALDMTSIDHTTAGHKVPFNGASIPVFESTYGEQFGPPRTSRALAIVHLAMFEAVNAIEKKFVSYTPPGSGRSIQEAMFVTLQGRPLTTATVSEAAAIGQAAHDTLIALYPRKTALIEASTLRLSVLTTASEGATGQADANTRLIMGREVGAAAAAAVLAARFNDGSTPTVEPDLCKPHNGQPAETVLPTSLCWETYWPKDVTLPDSAIDWTVDPIGLGALKLGAAWGSVSPFVVGADEFVTSAGMKLPSGIKPVPTADTTDFKDGLTMDTYGGTVPNPRGGAPIPAKYGVRLWGGYGPPSGSLLTYPPGQGPRYNTKTNRRQEQTDNALFWGYDATALLCAPPRLYNMLSDSFVVDWMKAHPGPHSAVDLARYLALVNIALADAGIESWKAKYLYHIARPISYLRPGKTPKPTDDAGWTPLGQVGSNGAPDNVTPGFPAYPSGHAVFGGALFEMMSKVLGVDKVFGGSFDFVSDEFNGHTFGPNGQLRPRREAHFVSLAAAEWENAESRIWLGIHWQEDADDGSQLGDEIAIRIFDTTLRPVVETSAK